jgi:hypothetical protein
MNAYQVFMAKAIADELKAVEEPFILCIYLKEIIAARCKIGGAKEGTCKGCIYQGNYCRELNQICNHELRIFKDKEGENDN